MIFDDDRDFDYEANHNLKKLKFVIVFLVLYFILYLKILLKNLYSYIIKILLN